MAKNKIKEMLRQFFLGEFLLNFFQLIKNIMINLFLFGNTFQKSIKNTVFCSLIQKCTQRCHFKNIENKKFYQHNINIQNFKLPRRIYSPAKKKRFMTIFRLKS